MLLFIVHQLYFAVEPNRRPAHRSNILTPSTSPHRPCLGCSNPVVL